MPPPLTSAARIASRLASAARKAEKAATNVNKGELAAAVSQLRKAKNLSQPTDTAASCLPNSTDTATDSSPNTTETVPKAPKAPKVPKVPKDSTKATKTAPRKTIKASETAAKPLPKPKKTATKKSTHTIEDVDQVALAPNGLPVLEQDISETSRFKSLTSYRNVFTYYTHQDYPLGDTLSSVFDENKIHGTTGKDKYPANVDVVSEALCDQIIEYLGHDLDKHKGCDIIDLHPGACLWSRKIHERLKPRRHLLLEPDDRYFDSFIKPLLDQKDSAYRHTTLSGAAPKGYFDTYDKIFNDHLLPKRDPLPKDDPRLREPNHSLLVIGSLVRRYADLRAGPHAGAFPVMILNQMAEAAQTNTMFQRYGLVRLLLWVPDETKNTILPDSMMHKVGLSIGLESSFDITEVVGSDRSQLSRIELNKKPMHLQRQDQLDVWGAQRVLERMRSKGMSIPEHRRSHVHQKALDTDDESLQAYNPIRLTKDKPLQDLVTDHEDQVRKLQEFAAIPKPQRKNLTVPTRTKLTSTTLEFIRNAEHMSIEFFVDVWGKQVALEHEYTSTKTNLSEEIRQDLESRLVTANTDLMSAYSKLFGQDVQKQVRILLDEIFALCRPNPMLEWDRRSYEPMTVATEEFWPRFPMRLFDLKPRSEALGDDLMDATESTHIRRGLLKALFTHPAVPLPDSVDRLGPGARDLIGPEFKDLSIGGRLDPEHILTKHITREQLSALTKAYIEWPFRPLGSEALEAADNELV
ncbi:S-adenosyl-L-methionine-dependent methyltransferase [Aureobasidium sp. EXF-12298]|nr:S-adenosyl-L-methionine-dependent methyltransferase [Aureobasidium sp. EXF-12298]